MRAMTSTERDDVLRAALAQVPLLAHVTPSNFADATARMEKLLRTGEATTLQFEYARPHVDMARLQEELEHAASSWEAEDDLGALYAARARELALEAGICGARGSAAIVALAKARYGGERAFALEADALARAWLASPVPADDEAEWVVTDDPLDPRSLLCRMRAEIGERRLPCRVAISRSLAPLAAVGDGVVQVTAGRRVRVEDVERTVAHEIEGHVVPSVRATTERIGLYRIGTARGSDHQEGYALVVEERRGHLQGLRRLEIAIRHLASRRVHEGWPMAETATELSGVTDRLDLVARSVCRAYRGGGLGREVAYLPSLLAVRDALEQEPELEDTLTSGRVSIEAARQLQS